MRMRLHRLVDRPQERRRPAALCAVLALATLTACAVACSTSPAPPAAIHDPPLGPGEAKPAGSPPGAAAAAWVATGAPATEALAVTDEEPLVAADAMDATQRETLAAWIAAVSPRRADEAYGELVVRVAKARLGARYATPPERRGPERLRIRVDTLECVSLVESSLALSRCITLATATAACFAREVQASRYRDGVLADYDSRLHYFADWLADNTRRRRMHDLTLELGGKPIWWRFTYMSRHAERYPELADAATGAAIKERERLLSATPRPLLPRARLRQAEGDLRSGDLAAIASNNKPGLLISHAGFVTRGADGVARLLHASSYQGRVVLTETSLIDYVLRRPERIGIAVVRPLPPPLPPTMPETSATDAAATRQPAVIDRKR